MDYNTKKEIMLLVSNIEISLDHIKQILNAEETKDIKLSFGEFDNVKLTQKEYDKSIQKYGNNATSWMIEKLSQWVKNNPTKKRVSHYACFSSWVHASYLKYQKENYINNFNNKQLINF